MTDENVSDEPASALRAMYLRDPCCGAEMLATLDSRLPHQAVHAYQD
ncbi:hypothetical protein [Streptomyces sp. NPDC093544]